MTHEWTDREDRALRAWLKGEESSSERADTWRFVALVLGTLVLVLLVVIAALLVARG
jgi:hypothetical protein